MTTKVFSAARILLGGLVAATLAVGVTSPTPVEAAAPPTTSVDPGSLETGGLPGVAWLDPEHPQIVRPHGNPLPAPEAAALLLHARGGYLTTDIDNSGGRSRFRVVFVSDGGHRRVVLPDALKGPDLVSADGRWLVLSSDRYGNTNAKQRVQVVRISDGRTVGSRVFPAGSAPTAAGNGRVVVRLPGSTIVWDLRHRSTRTATGAGSPRGPWTYVVPPASFGARAFVSRAPGRDEVRALRTGRLTWRTAPGEYVLSFSPDDRRVVTASHFFGFDQEAPWDLAGTLRVRDARTGRLLRTFTGHFGVDRDNEPVWESPTDLLLRATGEWVPNPEDEGHYADISVVRCSATSGACDRVPVQPHTTLLQRKSN